MRLDTQTRVAGNSTPETGQTFAQGAATVSEDAYDLGAAGEQAGDGEPLAAEFNVMDDITGVGTGTVELEVISADDAALTSNVTVLQERPIAHTLIVAGARFSVDVPHGRPLQRYLGARVTNPANIAWPGQINIVPKSHTAEVPPKAYPTGIVID